MHIHGWIVCMLSVCLSKWRGEKLFMLCVQDKGLICTDAYSLESKKLLNKNKKMDYMRYGERAEGCWEKIVQQKRRGEIVRCHKHHTTSEHPQRSVCSPQSKAKWWNYFPENMWCEKERFCLKLAMGFLDVCVRVIQKEHVSLYFHSVICSFQNLAF